MSDELPDRYHNREEDSSDSLRRSIDALADAVSALDRKLDGVTSRLGADVEGARAVTRRLAGDVAQMGEALVRRIEGAAPVVPVPVRKKPRRGLFIWVLGMTILLIITAAVAWLASREVAHPRTAPSTAAAIPLIVPTLSPAGVLPSGSTEALPPIHHVFRDTAGHKRRSRRKWSPPVTVAAPSLPPEPS